ncbi:undecaprenyl-diphosphate phosphatase [Prochlorococcus marinus]|uniref:Undecaprenyl-diphosphatase n=1 Tax=Prochlorococcus marinus (strain MIT 9211) TaxID=93059 RepID=A9B9V2_PROM4|nr:undecaprenyl-diphosphate phosphatase [Prochlorococcus marinus]ABX08614.1 Bacitracin resistance protein BacA [Prochlorococcus marinus str. MIT 9211]
MSISSLGIPHSSSWFLEECFKYFVLGIIQGITEFFPISSTAHLKVIPEFLGWGDPGVSLTAAIQFGSILAVVCYFWKDIRVVLKGISEAFRSGYWSHRNAMLGTSLIIGTLPILLVGGYIKLFWPGYQFSQLRTLTSIALVSILMSFMLYLAERFSTRKRTITHINGFDGLIVGAAQTLAFLPGASRSGVTISASLFRGMDGISSARFSFLLGIPAIIFSGLIGIKDAINTQDSASLLPLTIGIFSAAITSWLSIDFLLKFLQKKSIMIFVYYRFFFGIFLLTWIYTNNSA